jgi:hypothetical protein
VIPFHKLLITTAIVFCGLMTLWAGWRWRVEGGTGALALSVTFAVLALGLFYYLRHLKRFLGR